MVRYRTASDRARQTFKAETNWWLNTQALKAAEANLRAFLNAIDEIQSMLDRQISFSFLSGLMISVKLDIPPFMIPTFDFTYLLSILKNLKVGQLMVKISFYEAFLRTHLLPKDLREHILRLAEQNPELRDQLIKLAYSTLYDIFNNSELLRLLEDLKNLLSGNLLQKLLALFDLLDVVKNLLTDVAMLLIMILIEEFLKSLNSSRLKKGIYDETDFDESYYDPTFFQEVVSKSWQGLMVKDKTLATAREWYSIFARDGQISDPLTWDSYDRIANAHRAREGAFYMDYAWFDVSTFGPEGFEPLKGNYGGVTYGWHFTDYDNKPNLMSYSTEAGKEGWYVKPVYGMAPFGRATFTTPWPTDDHSPTVLTVQERPGDPPVTSLQELPRATDLAFTGTFDFASFDLLFYDTDEPAQNIYPTTPWDNPGPIEVVNTYTSLARINLPYAAAGLSMLEGPNSGVSEFHHTTAKDYALPYIQRTDLEVLAQSIVRTNIKNPTPIDVHLSRDAILQLFGALTSPRHWDYDSLRSTSLDELIKLWKERWSEEGVPEQVLDQLAQRSLDRLKSYARQRILQKIRSRYYRKWEQT